tara:strand:- start:917 stop:1174 length:258 start_codon:yes stop_codon:yes gene_type:complete
MQVNGARKNINSSINKAKFCGSYARWKQGQNRRFYKGQYIMNYLLSLIAENFFATLFIIYMTANLLVWGQLNRYQPFENSNGKPK